MTLPSDEALFNKIAQSLAEHADCDPRKITRDTKPAEVLYDDDIDDFDASFVEDYTIDMSDRSGREYHYMPASLLDFFPAGPKRHHPLTLQDYVTLAKAGSWAASGLGASVIGGYRVWPQGLRNRAYIRIRESQRRQALAEWRAELPAYSDIERREAIAGAAARFGDRPRATITATSRLYEDLDLTGWDYCDFLDWFRDAYCVDLSGLDISRLTVFGGPYRWLEERWPRRRLVLTVEDYVTLSKASSWRTSGLSKTARRCWNAWIERLIHRR